MAVILTSVAFLGPFCGCSISGSITGMNNSNSKVSHNQNGETLSPGQSVTFEMYVPSQMVPYLQFRVEGNISQQHLYNCQNTIIMPEKLTKPIVLEAIKDYNNAAIHEILESTLKFMPVFDGETRLADAQVFISLISLKLVDIRKIQSTLNELYKKHNIFWFHSLLKTTHLYLEHLKTVLQEVKNSLSSENQDKIAENISTLKSIRNEADTLNKHIEDIIETNQLSDEDVGYRYRTFRI